MKRYIVVLAALAAMAAGARAAPPQKQTTADATEETASLYESAFADYRRYEEDDIAPWREVNDEVGRLGGGHAHMRMAPVGESGTGNEPAAAPPDHDRMDHGGHR